MFKLAFLTAAFSYSIFLLGLLHLLKKEIISYFTLFFLIIFAVVYFKKFFILLFSIRNFKKLNFISAFALFLIIVQILINLIGVLGPELAFDALWYHLTIPKIYLQQNSIFYIGGILYYSAMPKLTEMIYLAGLVLGNEITAKVTHFLFGVVSLFALYKMSRKFLPSKDSFLVCLVFYSNLVVGWMSITAYIDLARTFFEILALWGFLIFLRFNTYKWLILSASMVGFAAACKLLDLYSVIIYLVLLIYLYFLKRMKFISLIRLSVLFCSVVLIIVSPWLIFSYLNTGYLFYPFFSPIHSSLVKIPQFNLLNILIIPLSFFLNSPDPVSPIYFIFLPLILFYFRGILYKKFGQKTRLVINILLLYLFLAFPIFYFIDPASSGRYLMAYLPAFSLLILLLLNTLKNKLLYKFLLVMIFSLSMISIFYRGIAVKRFVPVLLGKDNVSNFLLNNLEYQVGNFYDVDNYFAKNIKPENKVLIYGISNLYYVNFPYIHESWIKKGDKFDYILVKNMPLPQKYQDWKLIYSNDITRVKLYSLPNFK